MPISCSVVYTFASSAICTCIEIYPGTGSLALRKAPGLYVNTRPENFASGSLVENSSLKTYVAQGVDIIIFPQFALAANSPLAIHFVDKTNLLASATTTYQGSPC
ncbi:hypothetical protein QCA50_007129 [Cerrena zonata]|uniref:CN hydrolase domain-containing protein n=1 Tax=Cerrena zonata TaxID=2478898 RepID=A0AAW0G7F9_9APHY